VLAKIIPKLGKALVLYVDIDAILVRFSKEIGSFIHMSHYNSMMKITTKLDPKSMFSLVDEYKISFNYLSLQRESNCYEISEEGIIRSCVIEDSASAEFDVITYPGDKEYSVHVCKVNDTWKSYLGNLLIYRVFLYVLMSSGYMFAIVIYMLMVKLVPLIALIAFLKVHIGLLCACVFVIRLTIFILDYEFDTPKYIFYSYYHMYCLVPNVKDPKKIVVEFLDVRDTDVRDFPAPHMPMSAAFCLYWDNGKWSTFHIIPDYVNKFILSKSSEYFNSSSKYWNQYIHTHNVPISMLGEFCEGHEVIGRVYKAKYGVVPKN
jgi:hypothetical protein